MNLPVVVKCTCRGSSGCVAMVLGLIVGKAETPTVSGMKCRVGTPLRPVDGGGEWGMLPIFLVHIFLNSGWEGR